MRGIENIFVYRCLDRNLTTNEMYTELRQRMKQFLLFLFLFFVSFDTWAQPIKGQWRGFFNSAGDIVQSGGDNTEYVLELELKGTKVTGFSYSYFEGRKYYVICSVEGTYYKSTKSIKVTETARIKGFTPPDWSDCLQTHILTYEKQGKEERLKGRWGTAPGQLGSCGFGNTTLTRRTLNSNLPYAQKSPPSKMGYSKPQENPVARKTDSPKPKPTQKTNPPVVKKPNTPTPPIADPLVVQPPKPVPSSKEPVTVQEQVKQNTTKPAPGIQFEKRSTDIIKTIEIQEESFRVDLYDNGEVDGDTISLFYNGQLLLSHRRLGLQPITLNLQAKSGKEINELTMYAENLGSIPPNTAVMVVTDGDNRYEVRIASDLKKSGTIRFVHKPSTQ